MGIDLLHAATMLLTAIQGVNTYVIAVPADPGLLGLSFGIQAGLVGGARVRASTCRRRSTT